MDDTIKFVSDNFKSIAAVIIFFIGMYVQHEVNTQRIDDLEAKYANLDRKLDAQYQKIDAMKLDKAVFDSTVKQISEMSTDIREIRSDLKEVLKSK